jgi:hypothetical protein
MQGVIERFRCDPRPASHEEPREPNFAKGILRVAVTEAHRQWLEDGMKPASLEFLRHTFRAFHPHPL